MQTPPALNKKSLIKGKGFSKLSKLKGKPLLQKFKKMAGKVSQGHEFFRRTSVTLVCNDSSSSEESDEEDVPFDAKSIMAQPDLPPDFWQVQKLIRYLKIGNQTATIIALCNLVDFPLRKEYVQGVYGFRIPIYITITNIFLVLTQMLGFGSDKYCKKFGHL